MAKGISPTTGTSPGLTYQRGTAYLTGANNTSGAANPETIKKALYLQTKIDGSKFKEFLAPSALQEAGA